MLWGKHSTIENSFPKSATFKTSREFLALVSAACRPRDQKAISSFFSNGSNMMNTIEAANSQVNLSDTVDGSFVKYLITY